jgi:hypothetical protein
MTDGSTVTGAPGKPADAAPDAPRGLPRVTFLAILAGVVALFLLARGPLWKNPWDAAALDSAIFWSYLPIPFLVAGGLLLARRFSWRFLFLESLAITLLKYAITFSCALALWAIHGPPPPPPKAAPPAHTAAPVVEAPPPTPTPIPAERRGTVRGTVKNAAGEPVSGAFVYVAAGLESFVFERPTDPVRVENDGKTIRVVASEGAPPAPEALVIARAGQTILGRSLDGHLHTLVASGGGTAGTTFNIPMMSSGAWSSMTVREPAKVSRLRCTVHPDGEAPAYLVVLDHPFFATTAADGTFKMEGVPAGKITVAAWHSKLGDAAAEIEGKPRGEVSAELKLAAPASP